ncbi:MAG: 16S rRNA (cytidine(1402)-2'-O)-methyltransferase [Acidobacteriota bacterium]|nr:16S rRNA (cytidine(1402)-2'-O)-methyltransferase [Acidobacteriota bacterium]
MPGTLYVVATPIGNLEDVTLRALRILREVSLIAAEDTRRTARLLQHYSISTRTTSLHEHNERTKTPALIARLASGESIALVSDAGTPVVSDPGTHFVAAAHAAGIRVEPVPGASAIVASLSASGLLRGEFVFAGFPPSRSNARKLWFVALATEPRTIVLFEAPHRIRATLQVMYASLGDRIIAIARELTKAHEELVVGPISYFTPERLQERGEFTVVISGASSQLSLEPVPESKLVAAEFGALTENDGMSRRQALKALARKYGIPSRDVFDMLEDFKHLAE